MEPLPTTLHTERLILRPFAAGDLMAFFDIMRDEETNTFLPWFPPKTIEEAAELLHKKYLQGGDRSGGFCYAICLRENDLPIGYVTVGGADSYDFGYGMHRAHWHRGIVAEACTATLDMLRTTNIPYITATHDVNNPRSGQVMEKLGMTYRYSYEEQWQPKDFLVTFRMYQLDIARADCPTYLKYWEQSSVHFIEIF